MTLIDHKNEVKMFKTQVDQLVVWQSETLGTWEPRG